MLGAPKLDSQATVTDPSGAPCVTRVVVQAYLYDAEGRDREVKVGKATLAAASGQRLLWFDLRRDDTDGLGKVAHLLGLPDEAVAALTKRTSSRQLCNFDTHFQFSVPSPPKDGQRSAARLDFLIAAGWLLTVRDNDLQFLADFREQDRGESMKGALTPAILASSLLDWHLESYFDAITEVEGALDTLDGKVLASRTGKGTLDALAKMRKRVAVLRASVAEQRPLFHGLVRPDFGPVANDEATLSTYRAVALRFDGVVDAVERSREGIVSSFDLFTSKTGLETNELVKALTFVTVIIGMFAAVAGVFGMNFKVPIFDTGQTGFYAVLASLVLVVIGLTLFARRRGWI